MAIDKLTLRNIFLRADRNRDLRVTEKEINTAKNEDAVAAEDVEILQQTNEHQKLNSGHDFDGNPAMHLWEYMQAASQIISTNIFSPQEINSANPEATLNIAPEKIDPSLFQYVLKSVTENPFKLSYFPRFCNDRTIVMAAVQKNGWCLRFASPELRNDPQIVAAALKEDPSAIKFSAPRFLQNQNLVLAGIAENPELFEIAPLRNDPTFMRRAVEANGLVLKYIPTKYISREMMLAAVITQGSALKFAPKDSKYRADREIVLTAIRNDPAAIFDADPSLYTDPEIMLTLLESVRGHIFFPEESENKIIELCRSLVEKDRTFLSSAIADCPEIIRIIKPKHPNYASLVRSAVGYNGSVLRFLPSFQADRDIVLAAVKSNGYALQYAPSFQNDPLVVSTAVAKDGRSLQYADPRFRNDPEIVRAAIASDPTALEFAATSLQNDREIVLAAVRKDGQALVHANSALFHDPEIAAVAFASASHGPCILLPKLIHIDPSIAKEYEIVLSAVKVDGAAYEYIDPSLLKNRTLALTAIGKHPDSFTDVDPALQNDPAFVRQAFDLNFNIYPWLIDPPQAFTDTYQRITRSLSTLNINFFRRFNTATAEEIVRNRTPQVKDDRPLALLVFNTKDWNASFENDRISPLIQGGFRIIYYEAATEEDLFAALHKWGGGDKPISLLVIGGHGSRERTSLGAGDPARTSISNEKYYLDTSDASQLEKLRELLPPGAAIVLESCSTGEDGSLGDNLANTVHRSFPQCRVFAPMIDSRPAHYDVSNGIFHGVTFTGGSEKTLYLGGPVSDKEPAK